MIAAAVLAAVVAGGALVGANVLREQRAGTPASSSPSAPPSVSSSVGPGGCLVEPCKVLVIEQVAGTVVELVADSGARSGRLRIGGPRKDSKVIETTVTDLGVILTNASLQCVAAALSACVVRGAYEGGTAGQVVVGRSGNWSSLGKPFVSDAGYLAVAEVTGRFNGPEVLAAQHACDRATGQECASTPVFVQVFATQGTTVECTREFDGVESLPGYPVVAFTDEDLRDC